MTKKQCNLNALDGWARERIPLDQQVKGARSQLTEEKPHTWLLADVGRSSWWLYSILDKCFGGSLGFLKTRMIQPEKVEAQGFTKLQRQGLAKGQHYWELAL
jgi:hypothetical protein